ncbi:MAG: hypothetical protein SVX43_17495, partial [Cyanobacteriota bacterium]|nr:hypothetical protein [Cyanobacteriota bacterium]
YWVWLIPLPSGYTSIGIVTDEEIHPFEEYHTYERAYQWLEKHESVLAAHLQGKQPADFMKMPRYSYSSDRVFSIDRWACAGDAGVFADPLNSSGLQLCAVGNSLITQAIARDIKGQLTAHFVEDANCFFLKFNDNMTWRIQNYYACFRNEVSTALKYVWDVMVTWAFSSPLMFNGILLDPDQRRILHQYQEKFAPLEKRVQQLFLDWSARSLQRVTYDYIDYTEIAFLKKHRGRNFASHSTEEELIASQIANLEAFEEFARAIFLIAVADTLPDQLPRASATGGLNARAIGLDPERWEAEGLFSPSTQPHNLHRIGETLSQILQLQDPIFEKFACQGESSPAKIDYPFAQTCLERPAGWRN